MLPSPTVGSIASETSSPCSRLAGALAEEAALHNCFHFWLGQQISTTVDWHSSVHYLAFMLQAGALAEEVKALHTYIRFWPEQHMRGIGSEPGHLAAGAHAAAAALLAASALPGVASVKDDPKATSEQVWHWPGLSNLHQNERKSCKMEYLTIHISTHGAQRPRCRRCCWRLPRCRVSRTTLRPPASRYARVWK